MLEPTTTLETLQSLLADPSHLAQALSVSQGDVNALAQFRKQTGVDAEGAALLLQLAAGRQKAVAKFGDRANEWLCWPQAVEQATSWPVAHHKAAWIKQHANDHHVIDGGCGIGGDLFACRALGLKATGVELDPIRAWMAGHNVSEQTAAQVGDLAEPATWWPAEADGNNNAVMHLDPARRSGQRRLQSLDDLLPAPSVWLPLLKQAQGAAIKLPPGTDPQDLADIGLPVGSDASDLPAHLEHISLNGRMVEAVAWTGVLAKPFAALNQTSTAADPSPWTPQTPTDPNTVPETSATMLDGDGQAHRFVSHPVAAPLSDTQAIVMDVDPAIERAGLFGAFACAHGLDAIHPELGLYTSDALPNTEAMAWLNAFDVLDEMPWRLKHVQKALKALDAGIVTVRTRGKAVDPDVVQKQLRGKGQANDLVVFILRDGKQKFALITRRRPA